MSEFQALIDAFLSLEQDSVEDEIEKLINQKKSPLEIAEAARTAIIKIGVLFEQKEIYLTELIMAGEIFKEIMNKIGLNVSEAANSTINKRGKIVLGTVQGDIHDIGKNIVSGLLISNGFDVIDIGVDTPPEKFIAAIKNQKPQVIALSGLLTAAFQSMKNIVDAISAANLRKVVKIMIGGGAVDKDVCTFVGADGFGQNAVDAINLANQWLKD